MLIPPLVFLLLTALCLAALPVSSSAQTGPAPSKAEYRRLADEMEANLQAHVLSKWFPAALGAAHGGFHQNYREDWTPDPRENRSLVYQSRLTWLAAAVAKRYPAKSRAYKGYSLHGLELLDSRLWDKQHGGLYWSLDGNGAPLRGGEKHAYGIAFAIYAAAACSQATKDARALSLAKRAYTWLDDHAHDKVHGGYYEALAPDGSPILTAPGGSPQSDFIGTRYGLKSMNTHIHLLEALTELYAVWPTPAVRGRLQEVFGLVRDRIAAPPGYLNLFFTPDWRPVPDHDSFGHDLETAYLMVEASTALGHPDDTGTWRIARQLVDHALQVGEDKDYGGFYDSGSVTGPPLMTDKIWWTQAEGLNALALMHRRYGKETPRYWESLLRQWQFIKTHQVDANHGGWHPTVHRDGTVPPGRAKSDEWTECYHQGRALLTVSAALRALASGK